MKTWVELLVNKAWKYSAIIHLTLGMAFFVQKWSPAVVIMAAGMFVISLVEGLCEAIEGRER